MIVYIHPIMPRRKTPTKRKITTVSEDIPKNLPETKSTDLSKSLLTKKNIVLILVLLLIVGIWKFKGVFIAATVNGQPISKMELNSQLEKRFGDQVLDNIINERLIMGAARQKGIFVTADEIDKKQSEIENRLKGQVSLDDALKAQGMTKEDFRRQLEIQISIDKMFAIESTVSSQEVDDYISKNSSAFKNATDPAQVKIQVDDILHQQKVTDAFDKWFTDIKKNALVQKYI